MDTCRDLEEVGNRPLHIWMQLEIIQMQLGTPPTVDAKRSWHVWMRQDNVTTSPHVWGMFADEDASGEKGALFGSLETSYPIPLHHHQSGQDIGNDIERISCHGFLYMLCSYHSCCVRIMHAYIVVYCYRFLCCLCSYHVSSWSE